MVEGGKSEKEEEEEEEVGGLVHSTEERSHSVQCHQAAHSVNLASPLPNSSLHLAPHASTLLLSPPLLSLPIHFSHLVLSSMEQEMTVVMYF